MLYSSMSFTQHHTENSGVFPMSSHWIVYCSNCQKTTATLVEIGRKIKNLKKHIPSWTLFRCLFIQLELVNETSQIVHLNSFFPSWTVFWCLFIKLELVNGTSQIVHLNSFFPLNLIGKLRRLKVSILKFSLSFKSCY